MSVPRPDVIWTFPAPQFYACLCSSWWLPCTFFDYPYLYSYMTLGLVSPPFSILHLLVSTFHLPLLAPLRHTSWFVGYPNSLHVNTPPQPHLGTRTFLDSLHAHSWYGHSIFPCICTCFRYPTLSFHTSIPPSSPHLSISSSASPASPSVLTSSDATIPCSSPVCRRVVGSTFRLT